MFATEKPVIHPMKKSTHHLCFLLTIFCFWGFMSSCSKGDENANIQRGMYWWNGDVSGYNSGIDNFLPWLKDNNIQKIYFKLYDVDWNKAEGIFPADGPHSGGEGMMNLYYEFVPCVFITNQVFENATESELTILSDRISAKIDTSYKEYQIDCDWSARTKDKYFFFLNTLKKKLPNHEMSVTIRLYQYKYPEKTGVPPASRGALMLYNFSSPKKYSEKNSIFDKEEAEKYITSKPYALPLDFILPSFSWSVLYQEKEFAGLLHSFSTEDAKSYCFKVSDNMYRSKVDTVIEEFYIRKGNLIKVEDINEARVFEAKELIKEFKNTDTYTLSIFSLNSGTQNLVNHEVSEKVFGTTK
jgi:hypothetical protein